MLLDALTLSQGTAGASLKSLRGPSFGSLTAWLPYSVRPTHGVGGWAETWGLQATEIDSNWHLNKRQSLLKGHRSVWQAGMWSSVSQDWYQRQGSPGVRSPCWPSRLLPHLAHLGRRQNSRCSPWLPSPRVVKNSVKRQFLGPNDKTPKMNSDWPSSAWVPVPIQMTSAQGVGSHCINGHRMLPAVCEQDDSGATVSQMVMSQLSRQ